MRRWIEVVAVVALCVASLYAQQRIQALDRQTQDPSGQVIRDPQVDPQILKQLQEIRAEIAAN